MSEEITLKLTEEEAHRLAIYLGCHAVHDDYCTYSIFVKLTDIIDHDGTDPRYSPRAFTEDIIPGNTIISHGLFKITKED